MIRILAVFCALFAQASAYSLPINKLAPSTKQMPNFTSDYNFEGIVGLDNCSAALVRYETSKGTDKAIVMTNGHCVSARTVTGFLAPNSFLANVGAARSVRLLSDDGSDTVATLRTTKILYATMTGTDLALYELGVSFDEIESKYSVNALVLSNERPNLDDSIEILSGYWRRGYSCSIDRFVHKIKEDAYTWNDSMRYSAEGCDTIHGTSGSPVLSVDSRKVIGINNTGNDSGEKCTMDNPCEVSEDGQVYVEQGRSYAQQTYIVYSCLNEANQLDLSIEGCLLFH